ncbi:response regulator [Siphonobacter sp.]|uniref:response regulator n=1 Tax=Siphonobacter sp. TaxID=1869184 RepID=UPI003B3A6A1D
MAHSRIVYLVDDNADYRFLVQQVFTLFLPEHQVHFFTDGSQLVERMDALSKLPKPDLIVLDMDMPQLNGLQTLFLLKQNPDWKTVPVVMMTNRDQMEIRRESHQLGANAFLLKPLNLLEMRNVMIQLCEY